MRRTSLALLCLLATGLGAQAANLDVTAAYKEKGLDYQNLNLNPGQPNNQSFLENDARLGVAVSKIYLQTSGAEDTTMDVGVLLHALGVAGSTSPLTNAPFNRVANNYPSTNMTPFIENAYIRVNQLFGAPVQATFGRQSFKLGSGLLLDDDGAGLTGITVRGDLPFWNMKAEGFVFQDHNDFYGAVNDPLSALSSGNDVDFYGASLILPTDGVWSFNELIERDHTSQPVFGCTYTDPNTGDTDQCQISHAMRSFTDADYKVSYGALVFDGEAALEKGSATPTNGVDLTNPTPAIAPAAAPSHITYDGNAEVLRAKWKQALYHTNSEGIARLSFAHGSGTNGGTTDGAFMPSHGHQFDGLDRSGFGDFFGASPYSAFGGNYSTSTANGLGQGNSGLIVVGVGYTPPSYKGFALDADFFLLQTDKAMTAPSRTIGDEWDFKLRYNIQDHFALAAGADFVTIGSASNPNGGHARKYSFEAQGRF